MRLEHIGDLGSANGGGNVDVSKIDPNPPLTGSLNGYLVNSNYSGATPPAGVIHGKNTFGFNGNGRGHVEPAFRVPGCCPAPIGFFSVEG